MDLKESAEEGVRQCRFCLETEISPEEEWLEPCNCKGTARYVHKKCLDIWRRTKGVQRLRCQVCKAEWTVEAPRLQQKLFIKEIRTASRYRRSSETLINEDSFHRMIRIGNLIVQSADRANSESLYLAQHFEEGAHNLAWLQSNEDRDAMTPRRLMSSLLPALLEARAINHWHCGVFLILHVGSHAGADGSHSIIAANLTRRTTSFSEFLYDFPLSMRTSTHLTNARQPPTIGTSSRRLDWLRSAARLLRASRTHRTETLEEDQEVSSNHTIEPVRSDDEDPSIRSSTSSYADDGHNYVYDRDEDDDNIGNAICAYRRIEAQGVQCAIFSGGPVHREEALGLLLFENLSDLDPLLATVEPDEAEQWSCEDSSGVLSTLPTLERLVSTARTLGATNFSLLAWTGFAVWSADQLISEITRGSWVLSTARRDDLQAALLQTERRQLRALQETASHNRIWQTVINERPSTLLPRLLTIQEE